LTKELPDETQFINAGGAPNHHLVTKKIEKLTQPRQIIISGSQLGRRSILLRDFSNRLVFALFEICEDQFEDGERSTNVGYIICINIHSF
jgi:hypothetical protein